MLLKKQLIRRFVKAIAVIYVASSGLSVADASCILSLCRAKGPNYDCHSVPDSPQWVCKEPTPEVHPEVEKAHENEHKMDHEAPKTPSSTAGSISAPSMNVSPAISPMEILPVTQPPAPITPPALQ